MLFELFDLHDFGVVKYVRASLHSSVELGIEILQYRDFVLVPPSTSYTEFHVGLGWGQNIDQTPSWFLRPVAGNLALQVRPRILLHPVVRWHWCC